MTAYTEKIHALCIEDGDCLVWTRSCCNHHPAMRIDNKTVLVRRVLWTELHGGIPEGGVLRMTCNTHKCVHQDHMELTSYKKIAVQLGAIGVMSGPVRSAAIARTKRKTQAKLTEEAVRDIRSSEETTIVLAARHGVSQAHVSKIRKHKAWRDFSSPFSGLGARL